jgi:hypothetical protein
MALDTNIRGTTGTQLEVNSDNEAKVSLPQNEDNAGFVNLAVKMGKSTEPGGIYVETLRASDYGRLVTGTDHTLFNEGFPGSSLNTGAWSSPVTTMTIAVSGNFCALNSGASVASGALARLQTYRHFPIYKSYPTIFNMDVQFAQDPVANNVCEWGGFIATGTSAPTDGVFFRLNAAGSLVCVVNINGTETVSPAIDFSTWFGNNMTRNCMITAGDQEVDFYIDGAHVAGVGRPAAIARITGSNMLPLAFRTYNSSATGVAQIMRVGDVNVTMGDMLTGKPWPHIMCGAGGHAAQGQTGQTLGSTAAIVNNTLPAAAVPTNTTAALGTGLGGFFLETDTLAVNTDGIISSYQVPAGSATAPGKTLYITRITLDSFVHTVLVGGPYVANWYLAFGHTAVSLATADGATTKAPRRMVLGCHPVTAAQAVSTQVGTRIDLNFDSPIVVHPGEFVQLVKRKVGSAPSSGAIMHCISIGGYWE